MKPAAMLRALLFAGLLSAFTPFIAVAQTAKADANTLAPLREVLLSQVGKRVAVRLNGDQDIEGIVITVGADTVQLSKLTGKDYYDAVVAISKISAVIYKAR